MSIDTVCRLYEVGRQKLAEEGDDEEVRDGRQKAGPWSPPDLLTS